MLNKTPRIALHMNAQQAIIALSEGNPGAMNALLDLFGSSQVIDPQGAIGGIGPLLSLDSYGIYGSNIYVLHSDICRKNPARTLTLLRAAQLGILPAETLVNASSRQDYSGRDMISVVSMYKQVREQLPDFDKGNAAAFTEEELNG